MVKTSKAVAISQYLAQAEPEVLLFVVIRDAPVDYALAPQHKYPVAHIHWRGDFDWTGQCAVGDSIARYGALPWRMGLADCHAVLASGPTELLRGPAAPSPWDPPLAERMVQTGNAVMEERMIPMVFADIAEAAP
jgi:hypothetical protein